MTVSAWGVSGREIAYPVLVAPMAMQRLAHPDGELATSKAAAAEGIPMVCCSSDTQHSFFSQSEGKPVML